MKGKEDEQQTDATSDSTDFPGSAFDDGNELPDGEMAGDRTDEEKVYKYHVHGVKVLKVAQRVQYYDTDGKLVTKSFKYYTRKTLTKQFATLDEFVKKWHAT